MRLGWRGCDWNEERGQQTVGRTRVENYFLVAALRIGAGRGALETVERALAGARLAAVAAAAAFAFEVLLAAEQGQQRVRAQLIVIVEVLITQRQPIDALGDQLSHAVFDLLGLAVIAEASGELAHDTAALFGSGATAGRRRRKVIVPPSKRATTWRRPWLAKAKLGWVHSVMAKVAFLLAQTLYGGPWIGYPVRARTAKKEILAE